MKYLLFFILFFSLGYYFSCNDTEPEPMYSMAEPHLTNITWLADSIHYSTAGGVNFIPADYDKIGLLVYIEKGKDTMLYNNDYPNYWGVRLIYDKIDPDSFLVLPGFDTLIYQYMNLTHDKVMFIFMPDGDTFYMSIL